MSIWHWLIILVCFVVIGVPVAKILKRTGYSGWRTILAFVPAANLIGLWIFAYANWPKAQPGASAQP